MRTATLALHFVIVVPLGSLIGRTAQGAVSGPKDAHSKLPAVIVNSAFVVSSREFSRFPIAPDPVVPYRIRTAHHSCHTPSLRTPDEAREGW